MSKFSVLFNRIYTNCNYDGQYEIYYYYVMLIKLS